MNKLKILVVEDDLIYCEVIENILQNMGYEAVAIVDNSGEALRLFKAITPDLVLLDISIRGNLDGISVAQKINEIKPTPLIFITSHKEEELFTKAKQTFPFAYIYKDLDETQVQRAIEIAILRSYYKSEKLPSDNTWKEDVIIQNSFFIKTENKLVKVNIEDISWIEVEGKLLLIHTEKGEIVFRATLGEIEQKLPAALFQRVHRAYIVQLKKIESIDLDENVIVIGKKKIPIGNTYRELLMSRLNMFS